MGRACVCEREGEKAHVGEGERNSVCVRERESKKEHVCEREREREKERVCVRERENVCVRERDRERKRRNLGHGAGLESGEKTLLSEWQRLHVPATVRSWGRTSPAGHVLCKACTLVNRPVTLEPF